VDADKPLTSVRRSESGALEFSAQQTIVGNYWFGAPRRYALPPRCHAVMFLVSTMSEA
jgi:hypothetical protein